MWSFNLTGSNVIAYGLVMLELGFLLGFIIGIKIINKTQKKGTKHEKSN